MIKPLPKKLINTVRLLIEQAKTSVVKNINRTILLTYFEIGKTIVEDEQKGNHRAGYSQQIIQQLSDHLTQEFGKGYSTDNLEKMRKFYLVYNHKVPAGMPKIKGKTTKSSISESVIRKSGIPTINFNLSWTHYFHLLKIEDDDERNFYEIEAVENNWSVREFLRQYNSSLFERIALSRNKRSVKKLASKGQIIEKATDALKHHVVLEFLDLSAAGHYTETDLETEIINKLELFMLEMGKGFLFQARQKRFSFEGDEFYVDLVFYNRILKCFVIVDLKIGKLNHQDIGQMQMYVNYYDRKVKLRNEKPTIGIILCKEENKTVVEFTLPKSNKQIFAKEYKLYLPKKSELKKQLQ